MDRHIEIIAEIGINHNGSLATAKDMIRIAKDCGADVAKFQLYDPMVRSDIDGHPWNDVLIQSRITRRMLAEIKQYCDDVGIEFMASCFDVERVGWCEEVGMKRYKIASKSIEDYDLAKAISYTGKPVIVSYGMVNEDTRIWINAFDDDIIDRMSILYCVSKYPASVEDFNFYEKHVSSISIFNSGRYDGFSDHSPGITASVIAMSLGAIIIEKHFTLNQDAPGPDHSFSLLPDEFAQLCSIRDDIEKILYKTE